MASDRYRHTRRRLTLLFALIALAVVIWALTDRSASRTAAGDPEVRIAGMPSGEASDEPPGEVEASFRYRILIDAGHGGHDPGAEGASGAYEKDFTLGVAMKVAELLGQNPEYDVQMTRTDDTFIELEDRAEEANALGADAFVSIHGNTYEEDPDVSGTETYYDEERFRPLADIVHAKLIEALGFRDRGVKLGDWVVLTDSHVPAILLELGFMTNPSEEAKMLTEATQDKAAQAIADGLEQYFAERDGAQGDGAPPPDAGS